MGLQWFVITVIGGAVGLTFCLQLIDHQELERLLSKIKRWEGWAKLVCTMAAGVGLDLPEPPGDIDGE